jgi:hypothetical protein
MKRLCAVFLALCLLPVFAAAEEPFSFDREGFENLFEQLRPFYRVGPLPEPSVDGNVLRYSRSGEYTLSLRLNESGRIELLVLTYAYGLDFGFVSLAACAWRSAFGTNPNEKLLDLIFEYRNGADPAYTFFNEMESFAMLQSSAGFPQLALRLHAVD